MAHPRRFDVVFAGDPVLDLVVHADHLPPWGDKTLGRSAGFHAGGTEANAACAASRLGLRSAVFGAVGDDGAGIFLAEQFARFGVAVDHLVKRRGVPSAMTVIFVSPAGERSVVYMPMPAPEPRPDMAAVLASARAVYAMPYDAEAFARLAAAARAAGTEVVVDIEGAVLQDAAAVDGVLASSDILCFNEAGFEAAAGAPPERAALQALLARSVAHTLVVSLGARGAIALDRKGCAEQAAYPARVVDTTGAGDCFNAAFLACRLEGRDLRHSLAFACAAASRCIESVGARTSLPTRAEVQRLMMEA